jgi:Leucine-rich repeat (LRR) protein
MENSIVYQTVDGKIHNKEYDRKTEYVDLNDIGISNIIRINGLPNLQKLDLGYNKIGSMKCFQEKCFEGQISIQELHLGGNKKIERIEGLDGMINLRDLYLFDNQIERIEGLDRLIRLNKLRLGSNKIKQIEGLDYLVDLQTLDLGNNQIEQIEGLDRLVDLQELNLSSNQIKQIKGLDCLADLRQLILMCNQIERIEGLDRINIRELYLSRNLIKTIEGLEKQSFLEYLELDFNQIERIEGLDCLTSLLKISLWGNSITKIEGLDNLHQLTGLFLGTNKIGKIEGLTKLTKLDGLSLVDNLIEKIEGLENLHQLEVLNMYNNQIKKIEGIDSNRTLQILMLGKNNINRIEGLENLTGLKQIILDNNSIKKIEGLDGLTNLRVLYLHDNPIDSVPLTVMNHRHLNNFSCDQINPIVERFLEKNRIKSNTTVYDDAQNVHDSQINQQIRCSLFRLMETRHNISEQQTLEEIIIDPILTNPVKQQIVEYCRSADVHSTLNITFMEALQTVWQIIQSHEHSDCIKKILDQEMQDSICMCFTGRLSRLVNSLNGFDDRVKIQISDQQEIANLIVMIRRKTDSPEQQIRMARKELTERGYDEQIIAEWLGYLD